MKKIAICLLCIATMLTSCTSKKESNADDTINTSDKEIVENNNDTGTKEENNKAIIKEVKDYILSGQQDKSEAEKVKWSERFLDKVDLEVLYKGYLASGGKKDNVEDFPKYITLNAPISTD